MKKTKGKKLRSNMITYLIVIIAFVVIQALSSGGILTNNIKGMLVPICAYVCMAISLNLTVGILGELSLGHAGFMSVGAFTGVVVTLCLETSVSSGPLRLLIAIVCGAITAAIAGVIIGIPVLRLRGDYLAIVTLAFGEIIKNVFAALYIGYDSKGLHFSLTSQGDLTLEMEKVLNAMPTDKKVQAKLVLEINPEHPVFARLNEMTDTERIGKYAKLLYNQALLLEGMPIENPSEFSELICELM